MKTGAATAVLAAAITCAAGLALATSAHEPLPERLTDTGLFVADSLDAVRTGVQSFTPQYPLWSDGATKRRWISLPPGGAIDGSRPAAWDFPVGTKFWKEFSVAGRRVETRLIERLADGGWRFAAYVWNENRRKRRSRQPTAFRRSRFPAAAATRFRPRPIAAPAMRARPHRFSDSQRCSSRPTATRSRRMPSRCAPATPNCARSRARVACTVCRKRCSTRRRASQRRRPRGARRSVICNANCGHCHADSKLTGAAVPVELQLRAGPGGSGRRRTRDSHR